MIPIGQVTSPQILWWSFYKDGERNLADWSVPTNDILSIVRSLLEVHVREYLNRTFGVVPSFNGETLPD